MEILNNILKLLKSPRFVSFYWRTGGMASAGFLSLLAENIGNIGLPLWLVAILGLVIGESTKAINNYINNKPTGFVK